MKNAPTPAYLTAREAAAELSVTPATLYAYVSRGLIRSEAVGDSRSRRYRADDIRANSGTYNIYAHGCAHAHSSRGGGYKRHGNAGGDGWK